MKENASARAESERLKALYRYEVLHTPPEQAFDELTWLASKIAKTPIAVISLVSAERQWFKSKIGLEVEGTSRSISLCDYAIRLDVPLIVANTLEDERFCNNPLVTGPPGIRFYLGFPLATPDDHNIGTLCVIDTIAREPEQETIKMLAALARQVVSQLEFRLSSRKLKSAVSEAQQANEAKSNFLANMSHEIRTPLNGIIGMTDLLMVSILTEEQRQNLTIIKDSGDTLLRLINDILDLSKVEAGKIELEKVTFELGSLIKRITHAFEAAAREKGIALVTHLDQDLPRWGRGDPVRLEQVIGNLVSNAVKFTTTGEVRISAAPCGNGQDTNAVRVVVSDSGEGIASEKMGTIFEAFNQGDASTTRRYGGTGLGLAIVSRLVDLMGGTMEVQSSLGEGSSFAFSLPLGYSLHEPEPEPRDGSGQEVRGQASGRILLVDDNRVNLMVAERMLKHLGHECAVAHDGREALDLFEKERFDLILMDIQMPDMNGFQTATAIRTMEDQAQRLPTPIVALTAHTMKGDRERCLAAGMSDFIAKPITLKTLAHTIARQTDRGK